MLGLDRLVDRSAALGRPGPGEGHGGGLGEAGHGAHAGVDQPVDVRRLQPEFGERLQRAAGRDCFGKEDRVDPAGTGAGQDVDQDAEFDAGFRGDRLQQVR
jgi:hypothetical protein